MTRDTGKNESPRSMKGGLGPYMFHIWTNSTYKCPLFISRGVLASAAHIFPGATECVLNQTHPLFQMLYLSVAPHYLQGKGFLSLALPCRCSPTVNAPLPHSEF